MTPKSILFMKSAFEPIPEAYEYADPSPRHKIGKFANIVSRIETFHIRANVAKLAYVVS